MARPKKEAAVADDMSDPTDIQEKDEIVADSAPNGAKDNVKSAEEGLAELERKLKEADNRIQKAERERNEAIQRAYKANNEKEETDLRLIESASHQIQAYLSILEGNYANALAQGDHAAAAKIAREMSANEAKALQLENGKQAHKEAPKQAPRPLDPVESLASQLTPRSAAWVRAHPEYATNPKLYNKMIAVHNLAVAEGIPADTDDYFEYVEDALKINRRASYRPSEDEDYYSDASRDRGGRQIAPSSIPVSRDMSPSGQKTRVVRLTKEEAEIAAMTGLSEKDYWEQKQRIAREAMN